MYCVFPLTKFYSRKPTSRYEVVQLKNTMEEMLEKAGINDTDIEIKGPTQVRNQSYNKLIPLWT